MGLVLLQKGNRVEGVIILILIIPTLLFDNIVRERYKHSYEDASLLQTSRMYCHDGASPTNITSYLEREEYRRWLVDCHKASYLPTCLSGNGALDLLTAEPAVVISDKTASILETTDDDENQGSSEEHDSLRKLLKRQKAQKGGIFQRQRFNV